MISYSLNKKEWICSLFKEWVLEKSEIRVNLEWTFVIFTHFGVTSGSLGIPEWSLRSLQNEWISQMFTLISLFSRIHSLKSEHIHSFLFREYSILLIQHTKNENSICVKKEKMQWSHRERFIKTTVIAQFTSSLYASHKRQHDFIAHDWDWINWVFNLRNRLSLVREAHIKNCGVKITPPVLIEDHTMHFTPVLNLWC